MKFCCLSPSMATDESVDHSSRREASVSRAAPRYLSRPQLFICTICCIFTLFHASLSRVQAQQPDASKFKQTYEQARAECNALWSDPVFDPLRDKIPLNDDKPTHQMLTNPERLRPEDKHLADLAIKTLERCRAGYAPAYAMLPIQLRAMIPDAESRQDTLAAELYTGKITFGEFVIGLSRIRGEMTSAFSALSQSSQSSQSEPRSNETLSAVQQAAQAVPRATTEPAVVRQVRLALVVGNSSYSTLPRLSNPARDA